MLKLVVLDYDGTTVQSKKVYYRSVKRIFEKTGIPPISMKDFGNKVGTGVERFYIDCGLTQRISLEKIRAITDVIVRRHWDEIIPNLYLEIFLEICRSIDIPVIILSNNERWIIKSKLADYRLLKYFSKVICTQNKGLVFSQLIKKIPPDKILSLDDSREGLVLAKSFGITTAAFTNGYNTKQKILGANPDFPKKRNGKFEDINNFFDVIRVLGEIFYERMPRKYIIH